MKRYIRWLAAAALVVLAFACQLEGPVADRDEAPSFAAASKTIGINVLLNTAPTDAILAELALHGKVRDVVPAIDAVTMQVKSSKLAAIRALPYVAAANPDQERKGAPVDTVDATDTLLDAHGIPRDVEIDHRAAELQVAAFPGSLGGEQHLGAVLEIFYGLIFG